MYVLFEMASRCFWDRANWQRRDGRKKNNNKKVNKFAATILKDYLKDEKSESNILKID